MLIKAMVFNDWAMVQRYALEPFMTPDMAKRRGRQIRNYDDTVWEGVRLTAMCVALHCKFESTPNLAARLLSTGNAPLYECSKYDKVWGTGVALGAFRANWPHVNITGSNLLGKALGMVRSSLTAKAAAVAAEAAHLRARGAPRVVLQRVHPEFCAQLLQHEHDAFQAVCPVSSLHLRYEIVEAVGGNHPQDILGNLHSALDLSVGLCEIWAACSECKPIVISKSLEFTGHKL